MLPAVVVWFFGASIQVGLIGTLNESRVVENVAREDDFIRKTGRSTNNKNKISEKLFDFNTQIYASLSETASNSLLEFKTNRKLEAVNLKLL